MERLDVAADDIEAQRQFANALEATCAATDTHIHLVVHPRKRYGKQTSTGLDDIAGASSLTRLCDNALLIARKESESPDPHISPMLVSVLKQRYGLGICSSIEGLFDRITRQFKPHMNFVGKVTRYLPGGAYGDLKFEDNDPNFLPITSKENA
jgi:twinkle protein